MNLKTTTKTGHIVSTVEVPSSWGGGYESAVRDKHRNWIESEIRRSTDEAARAMHDTLVERYGGAR